jgi:hypothetical protein
MSFTTETNGRLCNQIIRNLAVSLIAKKHDLFVKYASYKLISALGIDLYIGNRNYDKTDIVNNSNYYSILNKESIDFNIDPNMDYFQSQEITDMLYQHLQSDEVKTKIMSSNPFANRYNNNNDAFIHIRLGDVMQHTPGLEYYLHCLSLIEFDNLYITTDTPHHPIIYEINKRYPQMTLIYDNEVSTIQFGSTCKNIILSHGSFSAVIGYLGFFSNVSYLNREPGWCPLDMFTGKGWNAVNL